MGKILGIAIKNYGSLKNIKMGKLFSDQTGDESDSLVLVCYRLSVSAGLCGGALHIPVGDAVYNRDVRPGDGGGIFADCGFFVSASAAAQSGRKAERRNAYRQKGAGEIKE